MTDLTKLKPRDRVRITVEGEVMRVGPLCISIWLDGSRAQTDFIPDDPDAASARVELIPPPVDPDLLLAREWFVAQNPQIAFNIGTGLWDTGHGIQGFLAGLKATKAGGKA